MKDTIYLISQVSSDNEYDCINYAYITITRQGLEKIRGFYNQFQTWVAENKGTLRKAVFNMPIEITYMESIPERYETNLDNIVELESPLTDDEIAEGTSGEEFRIDSEAIEFHSFGEGTFNITGSYKYESGGVTALDTSFSILDKMFEGGTDEQTITS